MTSFLEFSFSVSSREPCILNGFDFYWQIPRLAAWQFKFLFVFLLSLLSCLSLVSLTSHAYKSSQFYLFISLHTRQYSLCDNSLPMASAAEENWLGMPDLSWFFSATGKGRKERESESEEWHELLVSWPLEKKKKRGNIHLDVFQLLGMLVAILILQEFGNAVS